MTRLSRRFTVTFMPLIGLPMRMPTLPDIPSQRHIARDSRDDQIAAVWDLLTTTSLAPAARACHLATISTKPTMPRTPVAAAGDLPPPA